MSGGEAVARAAGVLTVRGAEAAAALRRGCPDV